MGRDFMKVRGGWKPPTGLTPEFGAIFMSNESTKHECLRNNLFGLPSRFNDFVKHVKVGMLLFLFEYENRELSGVYEATSDGAIDIVPHAYKSSGKKFPAQVQIRTVWNCRPLLENEFYDAIKDNYYQASKFYFGLSKNQVYHLLRLFQSKRVWTEEARLFSTGHAHQKEGTDESDIEEQIPVGCTRTEFVYPLCNYDELITGKDDPIIDSQLISYSSDPDTKKIKSISYHHPYDPAKPYLRQYSSTKTNFVSSMSGPGSGSRIACEGLSDELHRVTENNYSFIDGVTKDVELGDFIPLNASHFSKCFDPTTRNLDPDCRQTGTLSSRHYGYTDSISCCGVLPHHVRQEVASFRPNDEDYGFIYEANDGGAKVCTKRKRCSVFSRIKFAPKDFTEDSISVSRNESALEIMERMQSKHDNWSKELNRTNFNGHEEPSSLRRRESVFSRLRLISNPSERDGKGVMKVDDTIKTLPKNSSQKEKRKFTDKLDSQIAKGTDGIEVSESSSILVVKFENRPTDRESCSSALKQSKRRKLIRPVLGLKPLSEECVTHSNSDSRFPSGEETVPKEDSLSLVAPTEESQTLVGERKVSYSSGCAETEGSDKVTTKEAVHEVVVEAGTSGSLQISKEETGSLAAPAEESRTLVGEGQVSCKSSCAEAEGRGKVSTKEAVDEMVVEAGTSGSLQISKEETGSLVAPAEESLTLVGEGQVHCKNSCAEAEVRNKVTSKEAVHEMVVEAGICGSLHISEEDSGSLVAPAEESQTLVGEGQVSYESSCAEAEGSDKVTTKEAVHDLVVEAGTSGSLQISTEETGSLVAAAEESLALGCEGQVGCESGCAKAEASDKVTSEKAVHEVVVEAGTSGGRLQVSKEDFESNVTAAEESESIALVGDLLVGWNSSCAGEVSDKVKVNEVVVEAGSTDSLEE
ncbi:hypothetical protein QQ045_007681 [Rhodiola kirilowii]